MTTNLTATTPTSPALGPRASSLMLSARPVQEVAASLIEAGLLEEVRAALPQLHATAAAHAGVRGLRLVLEEWFPVFPQPQRSEPEWRVWYQGYAAICAELPLEAMRAAMKTWASLATSQFLPKPGELRALALSTPTTAARLYGRAKAVLRAVEDAVERQRIEADMAMRDVSAADQASAVSAMLADYKRKVREGNERARQTMQRGPNVGDLPAQPRPNTAGPLAPGANVTEKMLELMRRQNPGLDSEML